MRYSQLLIPTLKEVPADAQVASHIFLVRGGYIRQVAAGIYSFLPMGLRVVNKVASIVREELNRAGAQEVLLPISLPAELWQESGRWQKYGPELLRFHDRKGKDFCIGPTHEEAVVELVRRDVRSYRALPINLYQIQTKFRDEARPRAGLMRGREFMMKDAYSFHVDEADAMREYQNMYDAYARIFTRCGLKFRAVEAGTGAIGGSHSHEFQVLAASGEDAIVACDRCGYAANVELAELRPATAEAPDLATFHARSKVHTPAKHTVEEVTEFLGVTAQQLAKTLVYLADAKPVAVMIRGDRDVNEPKLKAALEVEELVLASDKAVEEVTKAPVGFAGPVGLGVPLFVDREIETMVNFVTGANEGDQHFVNVNLGRDFRPTAVLDIRTAAAGDRCARCDEGTYQGYRGIEVGQVFYLGTKYSQPMGCSFLDEAGATKLMVMGCYGIGVTRTAAAAIEQGHDDAGIIWPMAIAPFHVEVVSLQPRDAAVAEAAQRLHDELQAAGVEVLLDDRDERVGVKLNDADLIGIPLRVAVGKRSLQAGEVEVKWRRAAEVEKVKVADAARICAERVPAELRG
ncbi:MAG: proline--tRNA ligase [Deltaproteobacteria bacterium]|nr:proline--tRNA ligase [Deltaproteobacteria bacterium]